MTIETEDPIKVTENEPSEEELKDNLRFHELKTKGEELSEEEQSEITELKDRYGKRTKKRIDSLVRQAREAEEKYGRTSQELETIKQELEELKTKGKESAPAPDLKVSRETVEYGGKKFYTDKALQSMVDAGEIEMSQANAHRDDRLLQQSSDMAYERIKNEQTQGEQQRIFEEDRKKVMSEHPAFDKNHPDFNPNDPLYKEANRIYQNGYNTNPRGLSAAIEEAERILGRTKKNPDLSDDLNVPTSGPAAEGSKTKVSLDEFEKENAVRMFCRGDVTNPKTGRPYTQAEAIEKALIAKKNRGR